jgi:hypothetical protein
VLSLRGRRWRRLIDLVCFREVVSKPQETILISSKSETLQNPQLHLFILFGKNLRRKKNWNAIRAKGASRVTPTLTSNAWHFFQSTSNTFHAFPRILPRIIYACFSEADVVVEQVWYKKKKVSNEGGKGRCTARMNRLIKQGGNCVVIDVDPTTPGL